MLTIDFLKVIIDMRFNFFRITQSFDKLSNDISHIMLAWWKHITLKNTPQCTLECKLHKIFKNLCKNLCNFLCKFLLVLCLCKCGIIYTRFHTFYVHMNVELFLHAFIHFTFTWMWNYFYTLSCNYTVEKIRYVKIFL